jgi:LmbE family N-acetylglucosaminyl deacetylase
VSTVVVVSPHPDDETLGVGGTLLQHAANGDRAHVIFMTSGEQGGQGLSPEETRVIREDEAARAAAILGLAGIEFWHEPDGALDASDALIERLASRIAELAPTWLYAPHPAEQHQDHAATARAVAAAGKRAGIERVLGFEVWTPITTIGHIVDISDEMQRKLDAIRAYESQCAVLGFDAAFEGLARYRGEMHSWPGGPFAEVFTNLRDCELGPDPTIAPDIVDPQSMR